MKWLIASDLHGSASTIALFLTAFTSWPQHTWPACMAQMCERFFFYRQSSHRPTMAFFQPGMA